mgnify:CR=1 FL=1|jgi:major membrane immunogen (membrane-anchored lipoprotein)
MRKFLMMFFVVLMSIALFGCNKSEYKFDGEFLAFETSLHDAYGPSGSHKVQQVTWVIVKIEKGKIVSYTIDERQGARSGAEGAYTYAWNAKTKKELKFDYGMKIASGIDKEWFEQAEAIEAEWLKNGIDAIKVDKDGYVDSFAGATMVADNYVRLAKQALENAKIGKYQAIHADGTDLYSVHMIVEKKKVKELVIDTLQMARNSSATGNFAWNAKTKQELGYDYNMKPVSPIGREWFEQVNDLTDYIIKNGLVTSVPSDLTASVTVTTDHYFTILKQVFKYAGNAVK